MQLRRITEKLRTLLARAPTPLLRRYYGAGGLHLRPPLPLARVQAFEAEHRINLPDGYRSFVTQVGNGGLGPYYGLFPLEEWDEGPNEEGPLSGPFPASRDASGIIRLPEPSKYPGAITLADQGCGGYAMLVVTGPAAGRIFGMSIDLPSEAWFTLDASFLDWYERWLDSALAGVPFERNWGQ